MQIKYPSWLPKFIGSSQTAEEMNKVVDVIQNHAENLSRHYRLILTNVGGIYPDIIQPNSPFPEGVTQAVFLVGPGTYVNFGNLVVPNNNVGLIFYYDETFDLSLVPLETYDDTPLRNRVTALEDKNGGEIAEGNNKNVTGGQVHSAMQALETGGAKNLLELEDVDATQIPDGNFLVGKAGQKTEFRKLQAKDVRIGAGYQSGEYVVTWNYGTNNWGSGTLVTTTSIENSIAKRDARGRLIAEAGTGEKHLVNYGQLPFKLFESENEAQSYLLGGLAKYGQLIFLQTGPQKGRMLQVNETLDGYNTLFDYELNLSSLTDMNDFPNSYTDAAGKVLMVNPTSSGIQFKSIHEIDGIATYDSNGNLTATEATTNENVPTLGQVLRLFEDIAPGEGTGEENVIEVVKVNGVALTPNENKEINIEIEPGEGSGEENVIEVVKFNGVALTPNENKEVNIEFTPSGVPIASTSAPGIVKPSETISVNPSTGVANVVTVKDYAGGVGKVADADDVRKLKNEIGQVFVESKNLINTFNNLRAGSYNATSGGFTASNNWLSLQPLILDDDVTDITLSGAGSMGTSSARFVFFDENNIFISRVLGLGSANPHTVTKPSNAKSVRINIATGTNVGLNLPESPYHQTVMMNKGTQPLPWEPFGVVLKGEKLNTVYVDIVNGSDSNIGSESYPFQTLKKAIDNASDNATCFVRSGDYPFNNLSDALSKFKNFIGIGRVRFINGTKITTATEVSGYDNVLQYSYNHSGTWADTYRIWQRDIPDESTLIPIDERLPIHRGRIYRLEHTPLVRKTSIQEVSDSSTPCYYYDSTNKIMYFKKISGSDLTVNPIYIPGSHLNTPNNNYINAQNFELLFQGIDFRNLKGVFSNIEIGMTNAYAQFATPTTNGLVFNYCRAYGGSNDGFNGTGYVSGTDYFRNYTKVHFNYCWAHDNVDDGESHHNYCEILWENGLTEYNGNGNTPASGCHATYINSVSQNNTTTGFSSQGSSLDNGVGTNQLVMGCLSRGNNTNYNAQGQDTTYVNCISESPITGHFGGSSSAKKYNCIELP